MKIEPTPSQNKVGKSHPPHNKSKNLSVMGWIDKIIGAYIPKQKQFLGIAVVLVGSLLSIWLNGRINVWSHGQLHGLSSLTLAILIGMILGNSIYPKFAPKLGAGVSYSKAQILRLAIVMYGFKITLTQVASVGFSAVAIDALVLSSTFMITYLLGTKWLKMDKTTTLLIGSGASICGAAAVIAAEPVVKAEPYKVTIAVATVVVFGTLAMVLYPMLYHIGWMSGLLDSNQYGVYIGSTIHEVAQVVVAGDAIGTEAGNTAVVTKMIRVMMLAPFLLILSFFITSPNNGGNKADKSSGSPLLNRLKHIQVPWFAFVFIAMVAVNSLLATSSSTGLKNLSEQLLFIDDLLLTMAMFALGLTTHFSAIKHAGIKPLILASVMFMWLILGGAMINVMVVSFNF